VKQAISATNLEGILVF